MKALQFAVQLPKKVLQALLFNMHWNNSHRGAEELLDGSVNDIDDAAVVMSRYITSTHKQRRPVVEEVLKERLRQISKEGYSLEHDDTHEERELARLASAFVKHYVSYFWTASEGDDFAEYARRDRAEETADEMCVPSDWDFKPEDPRKDLIRAAALLVAEIERLDRLVNKAVSA